MPDGSGTNQFAPWYVMLIPDASDLETCQALAREVASVTGGVPESYLHVTIPYLTGEADPEVVIGVLGSLAVPDVVVRAGGLLSFRDTPHPLFGNTLSLRVAKDTPLHEWYSTVVDAVRPHGLLPVWSWEESRPHVRVVR